MYRLALLLGFSGYEALRKSYREWMAKGTSIFVHRVSALQELGTDDKTGLLIWNLVNADVGNLESILAPQMSKSLREASEILGKAKTVYVAALRSLFPAAYYFNYSCGLFRRNTVLLTGLGGAFPDELWRAGPTDALLVFSSAPYAREALQAVDFATHRGFKIVSVTDSLVSPIVEPASALLVVSNSTTSLIPSVVPALAVAQALVGLLVARGGATSRAAIKESEAQLQQFKVYAA